MSLSSKCVSLTLMLQRWCRTCNTV